MNQTNKMTLNISSNWCSNEYGNINSYIKPYEKLNGYDNYDDNKDKDKNIRTVERVGIISFFRPRFRWI